MISRSKKQKLMCKCHHLKPAKYFLQLLPREYFLNPQNDPDTAVVYTLSAQVKIHTLTIKKVFRKSCFYPNKNCMYSYKIK